MHQIKQENMIIRINNDFQQLFQIFPLCEASVVASNSISYGSYSWLKVVFEFISQNICGLRSTKPYVDMTKFCNAHR
jgi:hypothetical protein